MLDIKVARNSKCFYNSFIKIAIQPHAKKKIKHITGTSTGIAAYGHVAYNLGVAETNLVLRIA